MVAVLDAFVAGLGDRFAAIAACGMPDTLVHGDYHPGNVRGTPFRLTLLDWGDTGVGQPLLDLPGVPRPRSRRRPSRPSATGGSPRGAQRLPGADPDRAAALLAPVAAARQAVAYQRFVDGIEPVERRHHDADAREWLGRCAALVEGERPSSINA